MGVGVRVGRDYEARLARSKSHTFILSPPRRAGRGGVKKSLFWRLFAPSSPLLRQSVALRFLHFPRLLLLACSGCRPHLKSRGWELGRRRRRKRKKRYKGRSPPSLSGKPIYDSPKRPLTPTFPCPAPFPSGILD